MGQVCCLREGNMGTCLLSEGRESGRGFPRAGNVGRDWWMRPGKVGQVFCLRTGKVGQVCCLRAEKVGQVC